jgi:hypothetical protein
MAALSRREEVALLVGTVTPAAGAVRTAVARGALAAVPMEAVEVEAEALVAAPTEAAEAPVAVQAAGAAPRVAGAGVAIANRKNSLPMASSL